MALTRAVPPTFADCELTHLAREPIDLELADRAARGVRGAPARRSDVRVERVDPAPGHPDSVFIEDTAVVFDELARPGASRRAVAPR